MLNQKIRKSSWAVFEDYLRATALVFAAAGLILAAGRDTLGEAVIGLLYLIPVGYSAARWGQWPGICAAIMAFLTFDFFFIPPYYTFTVGSLEGWLLLVIFLVVAVVIVGRIQTGIARAEARERETRLLYELSAALIGQYGVAAVAQTVANFLQQLFQAASVQVTALPARNGSGLTVTAGQPAPGGSRPARTIPLYSAAQGLMGEIGLWQAEDGLALPEATDRFLQTLATVSALAFERARMAESGQPPAGG